MTRTTAIVLFLVLVVVTAATAVQLTRADDNPPATAATAVVSRRSFTPRVTASGSIRLAAGARIAVGAQVSGVVERLAVTQGSRVNRGDLIAVLDSREARARVAESEARLRQLRADSTQAAVDAERIEALFRSRAIAEQEMLTARISRERVHAQLASAYASRDLARIALERTVIRAPLSGIVASVSTHEGETVAASFAAPTFVTIVEPTRLECVAIVDETDIGRISIGQSAEFTVDAYPGRTFTGVVTRVAPDATIISGVVDYEVTIRVTGAAEGLKPQMTANVMIAGGARQTLVVPTAAVRQGAQGLYVWHVRGGRPVQTSITAGARQIDATEIRGGLSAGDTVLTAGFPDSRGPQ
jgi:RND family efflux transporter MFP subunit